MIDLNLTARALLEQATADLPAFLEATTSLVAHESPSRDKPALDALATRLGERLQALGGRVERLPNSAGGDHIRAEFRIGEPRDTRPALVLGHFDTVWPIGTLANMPIELSEGRLHGPGVYDMKSNLVLVEFALRAIIASRVPLPRPVEVVWTSDEEIGSPSSRSLIESAAVRSAYTLVPEPPLPGGALKTARKGVGRFVVDVVGRAAHAGVEPEKGISAIVELAHQILAIQTFNRPEAGTTVNIGLVSGGTTPNVVPAASQVVVDARATTLAEADRLAQSFQRLTPVVPGAVLTISGGFNRPPMERTPAIAGLFEQARSIAVALGLDLEEGSTGGGSDGNFAAAAGSPTLDGLGILGDGAHALHEHIVVESIPSRVALLALLLLTL
ncbi:MAG: M20 family metallopeptidase [Isosphaeraceae bacterium]